MKFLLAALSGLLALGAEPIEPPRIGVIDFYGLRTVSEARVRKALGVKEGDPLPRSKEDAEAAIEGIPGVIEARLQATCCQDGRVVLYVGVREKGAPAVHYREPPKELVLLPEEIHDTYVRFLATIEEASREGDLSEDLTAGHSLLSYPRAREQQEKFRSLAEQYLQVLRDVLRHSYDAEHRAIAAYVIGYAPDKKAVVADLVEALRDPDDTVRDNAMRALAAISVLALRKPDLGIEIDPSPFVELLHSLVWTDRVTAAMNLVNLTERRNPQLLEQLRKNALGALIEMARWKHLSHALPAFILLGRAMGWEEKAIQEAWTSTEGRAKLLSQAQELAAHASARPGR